MKTSLSTKHVGIIFILLLQLYCRFGSTPKIDFCHDDWGYLAWGKEYSSIKQILSEASREPDRPLYAAIAISSFHRIGDHPSVFLILSMLYYSIFLLLCMLLFHELTDDNLSALLLGVLFCFIPHLTSTFYWPIIISFSYAQIMVVASCLFFACYLKRNKAFWLLLSALMYAISIFSYELGLLLPAGFVILAWNKSIKRMARQISPFVIVLAIYLTWRFTNVFGAGSRMMYSSENVQLDLSVRNVIWNTMDIARWWAGRNFFRILANGYDGFLEFSHIKQWGLLLGNVIALAGTALLLNRNIQPPPSNLRFSRIRLSLFAATWFIVATLPSIPFYTAPRILILPGIGLIMLGVLLIRPRFTVSSTYILISIGFLFLPANQGSAKKWENAGKIHRRILTRISNNQQLEQPYDLIVLTTQPWSKTNDSHNPNSGIGQITAHDPHSFTYIRGFTPNAMVRYVTQSNEMATRCIIDYEHNISITNNSIVWDERFIPSIVYTNALSTTLFLDLGDY